ncbi:MAG TPA: glycosyltransferase family 39 protein [Steroidobacteraceae bacterium]|nr:glycosyltransferase family 39 protein [Steroidobacteraceae bacterium]
MRLTRPGAGGPRVAWVLIGVAVLLKLLYCGHVELLPEETYYWSYSRHLDIGYLDHPPMVAWLIRLGTGLFGQTSIGVRIGALLSGALASGYVYALTRNLFGAPSALGALVLMQGLPFFFMAGLLMTPDAPLTACWAAALYYLERALIAGHARAWWAVGVALGLGLLSKYTIVLLGASAALFILFEPQARRWLRHPYPYAALLLAILIFSPVLLWNAEHQWASFTFQTSRRLAEARRFSLHKLIASILVLLTPTGAVAVVPLFAPGRIAPGRIAAGPEPRVQQQQHPQRGLRLLALAAGVPLAVFALFSLLHEVKLDWTGAPWVAAMPVLGAGLSGAAGVFAAGRGRLERALRPLWLATLLILLGAYAVGYAYLTVGLPGVGYGRHPELVPVGWRALGAQVEALRRAVPGGARPPPLVVGMDRYAIASELSFYAPDVEQGLASITSAHLFGGVGLMYERWFPAEAQRGRNLLLIAWRREDLDSPQVRSSVGRLEPIEEGILRRADGTPIRAFYHRVALGYLGPPRAPP